VYDNSKLLLIVQQYLPINVDGKECIPQNTRRVFPEFYNAIRFYRSYFYYE